MTTPSIGDVISDASERGLSELLLAVADYFYCLGAGIIPPAPIERGRAELLATLEQLHRIEVLGPRNTPLTNDELPGWLLSQQRQVDPVRARAAAERQAALRDAQPPEGWS